LLVIQHFQHWEQLVPAELGTAHLLVVAVAEESVVSADSAMSSLSMDNQYLRVVMRVVQVTVVRE
jgi:hypothetical protein